MTKPTPAEERRADLRNYLMKCIAQNILTREDLQQPLAVLSKLGRTLLDDIVSVGKDIGMGVGQAGATIAANAFLDLASQLKRG